MPDTTPPSSPTPAPLAAELAAAQKTLAAQAKTIKVLTTRALEKQTGRQSSFALLEENSYLQDIVSRKTRELEEQNHKLEQAHLALKQAQNELLQAQKMESIGRLAAGIAHEINTPTQYIADNINFIKDSLPQLKISIQWLHELLENPSSESLIRKTKTAFQLTNLDYFITELPRAIDDSLEGIGRVTKIIHAMKEFSHPGTQEKIPTNLNRAIQTTVDVTRNEWKYNSDMELHLAPALPNIPCFVSEFNQCILNLIINAAHTIAEKLSAQKLSGTKGKITIATQKIDDGVEVRITDTGMGIPEKNKAHIFEPFFTTKPVGKGTGQGLTLVYLYIVKKHGGTVTFESQEGVGTTFILRLPLNPPAQV